MTRDQFYDELHYRISIHQAEKCLENRLISEEDFVNFREMMLEKILTYYRKISGLKT